jgi:hypothetical protein
MLTSPKYFSTQGQVRGHTLHYEDPINKITMSKTIKMQLERREKRCRHL